MAVGALCAGILDNTIPGTDEERGLTAWTKHGAPEETDANGRHPRCQNGRSGVGAILELSIEDLRKRLDEIDDELMQAFAKRMYAVKAIGKLKRESNRPVFDRAREQIVLDRARKRAEAVGLSAHDRREPLPRAPRGFSWRAGSTA